MTDAETIERLLNHTGTDLLLDLLAREREAKEGYRELWQNAERALESLRRGQ